MSPSTTAHISEQVFTRSCWVFLEMHPTSTTQDLSISQSLWLLKQSDPTVPALTGWTPTRVETGTMVCAMSSILTLVATVESKGTSALELEPLRIGAGPLTTEIVDVTSSSRSVRGCVLSRFWSLLGSSLALVLTLGFSTSCILCFWPLLPSAQSRKRARSSLSATASDPRFADADSTNASTGISTSGGFPEVRVGPHFLSRPVPGSLISQVPRLVCVCELVNVRDLQDRAPFVRQSYFDTLPCESIRTRWAIDRHTVLPQVCPCDTAPTWRQREVDDLTSWGLLRSPL